MPISYEPFGPVAPSLSAAGGAAEVMTKDFPTIASMYQHAAGMNAAAGQANAQRMQQDRQFNASIQNQQATTQGGFNEQDADRDMQGQLAQAHIQAAAQQQERHAQLQSWLFGQEMTQQEQMRLTQQKNAVSEIQDNALLTPQEQQEQILKLKTHIDIGEQRQKMAQDKAKTEFLQEQAKMLAAKTKDEEDAQDYKASKINDQLTFTPDAKEKPRMETEVDLSNPGLRESNPAQFDALVAKRMEEEGLGFHRFKDRHGTMQVDPAELEAQKAKLAAQKTGASKGSTGGAGGEGRVDRDSEMILKTLHTWEAQQEKDSKPVDDAARAKKLDQIVNDHMTIASKLREAGPEGVKRAAQAKIEEVAAQARTVIDMDLQSIPQRADLTPEQKSVVLGMRLHQKRILAEYKNYESMPESVKKRYAGIQESLSKLNFLKPAVPAQATPAQAAADMVNKMFGPKAPVTPEMLASGNSSHEGNLQKFVRDIEKPTGDVPSYAPDKGAYRLAQRRAMLRDMPADIRAEVERRLKEKGIPLE